jgi:hypothetical protein
MYRKLKNNSRDLMTKKKEYCNHKKIKVNGSEQAWRMSIHCPIPFHPSQLTKP